MRTTLRPKPMPELFAAFLDRKRLTPPVSGGHPPTPGHDPEEAACPAATE